MQSYATIFKTCSCISCELQRFLMIKLVGVSLLDETTFLFTRLYDLLKSYMYAHRGILRIGGA